MSQNSQENICARVSFLIKLQAEPCNFIKKETLAQVFSCEFCDISKNTFSYLTPPVTASEKEFLTCIGCFALFTNNLRGSGTSSCYSFSEYFSPKKFSLLYQLIRFQHQVFFTSQDITQYELNSCLDK